MINKRRWWFGYSLIPVLVWGRCTAAWCVFKWVLAFVFFIYLVVFSLFMVGGMFDSIACDEEDG